MDSLIYGIWSFGGTMYSKWTVALGLANFQGQYSTHWHLLMAASTAMTLLTIAIFFFAQRYFVEGIVLTGIKGA